jgi:hypothetical protein
MPSNSPQESSRTGYYPSFGLRLPPMTAFMATSDLGERNRSSINSQSVIHKRPDGYIDLTLDSSPTTSLQHHSTQSVTSQLSIPTPSSYNMPHTDTHLRLNAAGGSRKRRNMSQSEHSYPDASSGRTTTHSGTTLDDSPIALDLSDDDFSMYQIRKKRCPQLHSSSPKSTGSAVVEDQQDRLLQESLQSQAAASKGPVRLGQLTCIICMETLTDITATHCGKCL